MTDQLIQGSDEWKQARVGSLGASRLQDAIAKTKTGYGASRANLMAELICERLTGKAAEKFVSAAMQYGTETEPEARDTYIFSSGNSVEQVGLIRHPTIEQSHASPDGLVGDDGMLEIKCPQPAAHLDTLLNGKIPERYVTQMMWQLACSGRRWVDYVSYNSSFPDHMRLYVHRIERDDKLIKILEGEVAAFLLEMAVKLSELNSLYGDKEAA